MKVQEATAAYAVLDESSFDWPQVRVGDICKAVNGRAFKPTEWTDKGVPIIRIQNLKNVDAPFNYFAGVLEDKFKVKAGDLLFAWSGTPGTSFGAHIWHGPDAALNQHIFNLKFDHARVDAKYFCYALNRNVADYVAKAQGGVGLAHITKGKFEGSEIPLPPLDQQKRIVAEIEKQFSRLDEAVANLKRVKANLKRYKAAVLKAAVEGRLVETEAERARREGRSFETGAQLLQRILETRRSQWQGKGKYKEPPAPDTSDLPQVPEGWVWATLGALLLDIEAGRSFKCEERPPTKDEVGVVKVSAVTWGEFDEAESKTCIDRRRVNEKLLVRPGDFLFSRANTIELVGACVIAKKVASKVMLSDKILRFRLLGGLDQWVLFCLRSKFGRGEIERLATGNQESMRNIGQDRIRAIRIPLPPVDVCERVVAEIDRRLSHADEAVAQVTANLKRAEILRQSVLRRAYCMSA